MTIAPSHVEVRRPYPGLRPFEPHEAEIFFGREAHVDRLLEILQQRRFLAVIGPSGCGKSSLVRAGLLPAVSAGWLGTGSDWRIAIMRPGDRPLHELARTLSAAGVFGGDAATADIAATIETELGRGRRGLIDVFGLVAGRMKDPQRLNLLVLVDQFEELFTYARSGVAQADESADFVNLLLAAATEPDSRIYVVMTMRTDFLGNCVRFLDLPDAINRGMFLTPRLNRDEMRTAIATPAALFGGSVDDRLAGQLVNGVGGDSDELPILQHALARMWENATAAGGPAAMLPENLEKIGGLERALSAHADAVYDALPAALQPLAKKLFQSITERTSEEDGSRDVRRPRPLREIAAAIPNCDWTTLVPIVEAFAADGVNFLTHGPSLGEASIIDISHEALIRKWNRLQKWVAEEAERAAGYRRWRERAATGAMLPAVELLQAVRWRDGGDSGDRPDARWASRYASAPEFETTLAHIAASQNEERRRRRAKQWLRVGVAAGVLAMVIVFAAFKVREKRIELDADRTRELARLRELERDQRTAATIRQAALAKAETEAARQLAEAKATASELQSRQAQATVALARNATVEAKARQLMSESQVYAEDDPERAQLLAIEAYRAHPSPESESMVRQVRMRYASLLHTLRGTAKPHSASFSPDGKTVMVVGDDLKARLWDAATGREAKPLGEEAYDAMYSPDGQRILLHGSGRTRIWDLPGNRVIGDLPSSFAAFSPDGKTIVVSDADHTATVREVTTSKVVVTLKGHGAPVTGLAYSPDGKMIATVASDKTLRLWDANDGKPLLPPTPVDPEARIAFSPDGKRLLILNRDQDGQIASTATGVRLALSEAGHLNDAAFSPDGAMVVTGGKDGKVRSWDAATGKQIRTLFELDKDVPASGVAFSPDGKTVLVAADDGTVRLFGAAEGEAVGMFDPNDGPIMSAAFSPDGKTVVTAHNHAVRLWDAGAGHSPRELARAKSVVNNELVNAAFTPDGKSIVTVGEETRVWDVASWTSRVSRTDKNASVLSPDGGRILALSKDEKALEVFDSVTGRRLGALDTMPLHESGLGSRQLKTLLTAAAMTSTWRLGVVAMLMSDASLVFSANGQRVMLATETKVYVWETRNGKFVASLEEKLLLPTFSPDGKLITALEADGRSCLWNLDSRRKMSLGKVTEDPSMGRTFSPDGNILATGEKDGVRLWDTRSGRPIRRLSHQDVMNVVFSPDGNTVITTDGESRTLLWDLRTGRSITLATPPRTRRAAKKTEEGETAGALFAAFSPDGKVVAAPVDENTIRLWDTATGRQLLTIEANQAGGPIAFDPKARLLMALSVEDGAVRIWEIAGLAESVDQAIAAIELRVGRSLSAQERQQANLPAENAQLAAH